MRFLLRSAIAIVPMLYPTWASAEVIRLDPADQQSVVESTVALDIIAADMNVGAFDLEVTFDPLLLWPTAIEFDAFLGFPVSLQYSSIGFSSLNVTEISLLSPGELIALQQDDFRLARLEFETLMAGVTTVSITSAVVADPDAAILNPVLVSATVTIEERSGGAVPEPGSGLLFVAGVLAAASRAIRHRQRLMAGGIGRRSTDK